MSNDTPTQTAPMIGEYKGRLIPAWLNVPERGGRCEYVGIAAEDRDGAIALHQLSGDEVVIAPGLIYRKVSAA